jgi:flavin reductase (DIM6/NTAB) family NADH-FMN oxidoreductase RutF
MHVTQLAMNTSTQLDARTYRDALGLFATGVAVIVTERHGEVHAMTANAVSSVSLDPMLILFCPGKSSQMGASLGEVTTFSLNFLRSEQQALSTYFAGGWKALPAPSFRFVQTHGTPRLEGSLAALICEKHQIVDAGDHWIVIGRVTALHLGIEPCRPLLFFRGRYQQLGESAGPAPDLTEADEPPHIYYSL